MMRLSLSNGLVCATCGNFRSDQRTHAQDVCIALFGVVPDPFAVCPTCRIELQPEEQADPDVRSAIRLVYLDRGIALRRLASGRWIKVALDLMYCRDCGHVAQDEDFWGWGREYLRCPLCLSAAVHAPELPPEQTV